MASFLPAFYEIYSFHAFQKQPFLEALSLEKDIRAGREQLRGKIVEIEGRCSKYHNEDI